MRLGLALEPSPNSFYRAISPMRAMEARGHTIVWPGPDGAVDAQRLRGCDVVHVYRRAADDTRRILADLSRRGTRVVYDNDDDFTTVPKESPVYAKVGGEAGKRIFAMTVKTAQLADTFTTTTEALADRYRQAGVERIEVIGNYLAPGVARGRREHKGLVIGWVAGRDHLADSARIDIAGALRRVMAKHPHVRVECIGVDLALPERYQHDEEVNFHQLPERIGGFDVGIAPLADIPANRTRSDIKLKEYAASGVPWLASPVGPYQGMGEVQGGWLVADDGWSEALDRLIGHRLVRWRLGRRGAAWARRQTIAAVADRWEKVFQAG